MGHCDAGFDAELVRLPGFPLADAFHFRRVQGVELVLVLRLLGADALGSFQKAEVMVAPSLMTEGKKLQKEQDVGMG